MSGKYSKERDSLIEPYEEKVTVRTPIGVAIIKAKPIIPINAKIITFLLIILKY
ncbi:unnamed protein product, partial [marine sediment metagenome]